LSQEQREGRNGQNIVIASVAKIQYGGWKSHCVPSHAMTMVYHIRQKQAARKSDMPLWIFATLAMTVRRDVYSA